MAIKLLCAWCNKLIRAEATEKYDMISHGICSTCANTLKKEMGLPDIEQSKTLERGNNDTN
jgi:hypothetical protein